MKLNINIFCYILILILGFDFTNSSYWPPTTDESLELKLKSRLQLGCDKENITKIDNSQIVTVITQTENGFSPIPSTFIHIPSGKLFEQKVDCDECNPFKFTLNNIDYNMKNFTCKTLCIFTGVKNNEENCKRGEYFNIGIKIKNYFIKIMESCHNLELTNLTYMRDTVHKKLGKFSRKILDTGEKCRTKCMPVCMQPLKLNNNNTDNNNKIILNNEEFENNFMENFCLIEKNGNMNMLKMDKQDVCNGGTSKYLMKFFMTSLMFLVFFNIVF